MRWLVRLAVLACFVAIAALAGAAWLVGTEAGLQWLAARAVAASGGRLAIEGARGALAGTVRVERLAYRGPGASAQARKLAVRFHLPSLLAGRLAIDPLEAASLVLELEDPGEARAGARARLPLGIRLRNASFAAVEVRRGERHETLRDLRVERADVGPQVVAISGSFSRPHPRFPAQVAFELDGSLERLALAAKVGVREAGAEIRAVLVPSAPRVLQSVEARAGPIDLSRFDSRLPATAIELRLEGAATARHALAGSLAATNAAPGPLDKQRAPVSSIAARFASGDFSAAALEGLRIVLAEGSLEGRAELSARGVRAQLRAAGVNLRALRSTLRETDLRGRLELELGSTVQRLEAELRQDALSLAAQVERAGERLHVRRLRASAHGGELTGEATVRLGEAPSFEARLALARFDPAAFGDYPEGSLNASIRAAGTLGARRSLEATWSIAESTLLGHPLESRGSVRLAGARLSRATARARLGSARAAVQGAFGARGDELSWRLELPRLAEFADGLGGALEAQGTLEGSLATHRIEGSARGAGWQGQALLEGGWKGEAWSGTLERLTSAGEYPLRLLRPAQLSLSRGRFALGRLEARLGEGSLLVREASWRDGRFASSGEFAGLPSRWLLDAAGLAGRVRATLQLDGEWTLAAAPRIEGSVRLRRAGGDLETLGEQPVALGLTQASLDLRFTGEGLEAQAALASRFGRMTLEGRLGPDPGAGPLGIGARSAAAFRAEVDFAALRVLAQPYLEDASLDGRLRAEVRASGTLAELRLQGTMHGEAIRLELPAQGVFLHDGELLAVLEGERLRIERFSIGGGRGRLSARGSVPLLPGSGTTTLDWRASEFTLIERADLQLVASGSGEAGFDGKRLRLEGELRADRGRLELERERLPQLGEDVVVLGAPGPQERRRAPLPIALDLFVDLGSELEVQGRGLHGKLAGRLQLRTSAGGELRAYGQVRTVDATYLAYGQLLEVDPGVLTFDGPIDNPSLQITAWRRNQAVEAGVQLSGTAQAPIVELVSKPPVPEGEQLSWLVLGRAPSDATQADLGLLQAAAGALLARGENLPLDRRLARSVGLDELTLRGTGEVEGRVVAVGKRLSERAYVSYERGIGAAATSLVKLDYALSQRWSLRAETGSTTSGGATSGWGLFYRFSWD